MNPECMYCKKEMFETNDGYCCMGEWPKDVHYHWKRKEDNKK